MSTSLRGSQLIQQCPPSISYDRQVQAAGAAIDPQFYSIIDDTGQVIMIPNIMGLTDPELVDALAWQFHVDGYDATAPLEFRKQLVQDSILWHMTKGTVHLVQTVIDTYWPGGATLQEWFEYKNPLPPPQPPTNWSGPLASPNWHERYYFRLVINPAVIVTPEDEAAVLELVNRYKPVSRWCETILQSDASSTTEFVGIFAQLYINIQSTGTLR
jgi:Phage tail protein (Tail_P2_I)